MHLALLLQSLLVVLAVLLALTALLLLGGHVLRGFTAAMMLGIIVGNLAELIEDALLQNHAMLAFKGIAVSVDCPSDCYAYLERELVKGALINGLNNAYQYTRDRIHVQARSSADGLELRVEDNGRGYPQRLLTDALDHQGVDFDSGSTGLGFYFCAQVAGLHKSGGQSGQLRIENGGSLGGGCFLLRLP